MPGKPELLGTTREFLDYFSLKKLDDLPTLAQLKELEDLRVQLTLPGRGRRGAGSCAGRGGRGIASDGAEAAVASTGGAGDPAPGADGDASEDDERNADDRNADELDAAEAEPRAQGLVARGFGDGAD